MTSSEWRITRHSDEVSTLIQNLFRLFFRKIFAVCKSLSSAFLWKFFLFTLIDCFIVQGALII